MARKKMSETGLAVIGQELGPLANVEEVPPEAKPLKKKIRQTQVAEWIEDAPRQEAEEVEEEAEFEYEENPLDAIIQDFDESAGSSHFIKVYRLPNYAKDGKSGVNNVEREYCARLPATLDYLDTIREGYGPGHYQLELRPNKGGITRRQTITIAAPRIDPAQTVIPNPFFPTMPSQNNGQVQMPSIDPMQQFDFMLDRVGKVMKTFGVNLQNPAVEPQAPQLSVDEQVAIYAMKQPDLAKQAFKNLLGNDAGEERTWIDVVFALVNNLPASIEAAKTFFGGQQNGAPQAQASTQYQPQQAPNFNGLGNRTENSPTINPSSSMDGPNLHSVSGMDNQPNTTVPPEVALLNMSVGMFMERWSPDSAADEIQKYAELNPDVKPFVEGFMDTTPAMALAWIKSQAANNPVVMQALNSPAAEKWIEALQDYLRPEEGSEEDA